MNPHRPPRLAQLVLRCLAGNRHQETLEGDLIEELASGRSVSWFWQQTLHAVIEQLRSFLRQEFTTILAATAFFLVALWIIAPATYPVLGLARTSEPLRTIVLLGWLTGVPMLLGGIAGATDRRRHIGAILLGANVAWLTPVTQPFDSAVCDLCVGPGSSTIPAAALFFTPYGSALLAGLGAWIVFRIRGVLLQEQQ